MSLSNDGQYDYQDSGFDSFLSRSIDSTPRINLDSGVSPNNSVAFDRTQVTGIVGDTFRGGNAGLTGELLGNIELKGTFIIGGITLDGTKGNIIVNDGENDFLIIGDE